MLRALTIMATGLTAAAASAQDTVPTASPDAGREVYSAFCATCHGPEGRGDGPMSPILTVLPSDLTRLSEANGGSFPLVQVIRQIDGRDPMLAHGGAMPLFGDFFEGRSVAVATETGQPLMTSQPIADVTAYLASIQE